MDCFTGRKNHQPALQTIKLKAAVAPAASSGKPVVGFTQTEIPGAPRLSRSPRARILPEEQAAELSALEADGTGEAGVGELESAGSRTGRGISSGGVSSSSRGAAPTIAAAEEGSASGLFGGALAAVSSIGAGGLLLGGAIIAAAAASNNSETPPTTTRVDTSGVKSPLALSVLTPLTVDRQTYDATADVLYTRDGNAVIEVSSTQEGVVLQLLDLNGKVLDTAKVVDGVARFRLSLDPAKVTDSFDSLVIKGVDLLDSSRVVTTRTGFSLTVDAKAPVGTLGLALGDAGESALVNVNDAELSVEDLDQIVANPISLKYDISKLNVAEVASLQVFDAATGIALSPSIRPEPGVAVGQIKLTRPFLLAEGNNDVVVKAFDAAGNGLASNVVKIEKNTGIPDIRFSVENGVQPTGEEVFLAAKDVTVSGIAEALRGQVVVVSLKTSSGQLVASNQVQLDEAGNFSRTLTDSRQKAVDLSQIADRNFEVSVSAIDPATGKAVADDSTARAALELKYVPTLPAFSLLIIDNGAPAYDSARVLDDQFLNREELEDAPSDFLIRLQPVSGQSLDSLNPDNINLTLLPSSGSGAAIAVTKVTGTNGRLVGFKVDPGLLLDGTYTLSVAVTDYLGRSEQRSFALNVDTSNPVETLINLSQSGAGSKLDGIINDAEALSYIATGQLRFSFAKPSDAKVTEIVISNSDGDTLTLGNADFFLSGDQVTLKNITLQRLASAGVLTLGKTASFNPFAPAQDLTVEVTFSDAAGNKTTSQRTFEIDRNVLGGFNLFESSVVGVNARGAFNPFDRDLDGALNASELSGTFTSVKAILNTSAQDDGVSIASLVLRDSRGNTVATAVANPEDSTGYLFDNSRLRSLADGDYTVVALVQDVAGNTSEFILPGRFNGGNALRIDKTGVDASRIEVFLGGNDQDATEFARDVFVNNVESRSGSFTIVTEGVQGFSQIKDNRVQLFSASDTGRTQPFAATFDSQQGSAVTFKNVKWDSIPEGRIIMRFVAIDSVGNETLVEREFIKDSSPPQGSLTLGVVDFLSSNEGLRINLRVNDVKDEAIEGITVGAKTIYGQIDDMGQFVASGEAGLDPLTESFRDTITSDRTYASKLRDNAGNENFAQGITAVRFKSASADPMAVKTSFKDTDFEFADLNNADLKVQATKVLYNLDETFDGAFAEVTLNRNDFFFDEGANSTFTTKVLDFGFLQGGSGIDTLRFEDIQSVNFKDISNRVKGIDVIDLTLTEGDKVTDQILTVDGESAKKLFANNFGQILRVVGDNSFEDASDADDQASELMIPRDLSKPVIDGVEELTAGFVMVNSNPLSTALNEPFADKLIVRDQVKFAEKLFDNRDDLEAAIRSGTVQGAWLDTGLSKDEVFRMYEYFDNDFTSTTADAVVWIEKELSTKFEA